jgi:peroxiredoxin
LPDLEHGLYSRYDRDDVYLVGVYDVEEPRALEDFKEQTGVTFPLLRDRGTLFQLEFPEGVGYPYPRDVIIGPDLTIRAIRNNYNAEEVHALIDELLAE